MRDIIVVIQNRRTTRGIFQGLQFTKELQFEREEDAKPYIGKYTKSDPPVGEAYRVENFHAYKRSVPDNYELKNPIDI